MKKFTKGVLVGLAGGTVVGLGVAYAMEALGKSLAGAGVGYVPPMPSDPADRALVSRVRTVGPDGSVTIHASRGLTPHQRAVVERATGANRAMIEYGYRSYVPWLPH